MKKPWERIDELDAMLERIPPERRALSEVRRLLESLDCPRHSNYMRAMHQIFVLAIGPALKLERDPLAKLAARTEFFGGYSAQSDACQTCGLVYGCYCPTRPTIWRMEKYR